MAIVNRRYQLAGPSVGELLQFVGPSSAVVERFETPICDVAYDNTTPGITETIDEYMDSLGYRPELIGNIKYDILERIGDPLAVVGRVRVYSKLVAGVTQLFARDGAGVVYQLTPTGITFFDEGVALVGNPHTEMDFIGAGVQVVDAGAGRVNVFVPGGVVADGAVFFWGVDSIQNTADTRFIPPGHDNGFAVVANIYQVPMPRAGTLRNLFVRHNSAGGNGNNVVYTVMVNNVATTITVTLATAAIGQVADLVHGVAVAQGDRISLRAVKAVNIGGGSLDLTASLELD